ncbi:MAG: hypothetical protein OWQ54_03120 [Sulfolobaceae archaeon]|nr:hypothetical protein [Sulfolobaceae archaeon]
MYNKVKRASIVFTFLLLFLLSLAFYSPTLKSQQSISLELVPSGITITLPTNTSTAKFTVYVVNNNPSPSSGTITISGATSGTYPVTAQPYSYQAINVTLNQGVNTIALGSQTLTVNVTFSPQILTLRTLFNSTVYNLQPGNYYDIRGYLTFQFPPHSTLTSTTVTQGVARQSLYEKAGISMPAVFSQPINSTAEGLSVDLYVPSGEPQGLYYYYFTFEAINTTVVSGKLQEVYVGFVGRLLLFNISYGLTGSLPSPAKFSANGINVEFQTIGGKSFIIVSYPFSIQNSYTIELAPYGSETAQLTLSIGNQTASVTLQGVSSYVQYYGQAQGYEMAMGNNWVEVEIPEPSFGGNFSILVSITTPTGTVSTGWLNEPVTTTTTTSTTSTTTTTSSTTTTTSTPTTTTVTSTTTSTTTVTTVSTTTVTSTVTSTSTTSVVSTVTSVVTSVITTVSTIVSTIVSTLTSTVVSTTTVSVMPTTELIGFIAVIIVLIALVVYLALRK